MGTLDRVRQFRNYLEKHAAWDSQRGIKLKPYADPMLPHFSALPVDHQENILQNYGRIIDWYEAVGPQAPFDDRREELKSALASCGMHVHPEALARVGEASVYDSYTRYHTLLYMGLPFQSMLSYTLEDVHSIPWYKLYVRDIPSLDRKIMNVCEELLAGKYPTLVEMNPIIGDYVGYEVASEKRHAGAFIPEFFAPIYQGKDIAGFLCVNTAIQIPGEFRWE